MKDFDFQSNFAHLHHFYSLTDSNNKEVKVGEKRIYAPNFIYINEGKEELIRFACCFLVADNLNQEKEDFLNSLWTYRFKLKDF